MPNEWWERLGLTEPAEGENDPSGNAAADPTTAANGEKEPVGNAAAGTGEQTITAPAPQETAPQGQTAQQETTAAGQTASEDGAAGKDTPAADGAQKQEQSAEERHANAERRRRETEAQMQKQITENVLKGLNLTNPYNENKPVTTVEEYEQYKKDIASAKLKRELKSGELSVDTLEEAMLQSKTIREIVSGAGREAAAAQEAQEEANKARYAADMQRQIAEIQKINPQIKTLTDIVGMETGVEFARLVRTGLTPVEAYKLANHDSIISGARSAAEQAARNAAAGKGHLEATKGTNAQGFEITEATRQRYRRFNPNITDAQIAEAEKIVRGK